VYRTLLLTLTLAGLAVGCSRPPPPAAASVTPAAAPAAAPAASVRADAIRSAATRLPNVSGHRDGPGGAAQWKATFAGDELTLIEESVADGPRPPLENRYYFERGTLFYFTGQQAAAPGGGAEGPGARVPLTAEFRGLQPVSAVRIEHYGPVPLAAARIQQIAARAAELASAARDERSGRQVAP
jgi:hypothetical protein